MSRNTVQFACLATLLSSVLLLTNYFYSLQDSSPIESPREILARKMQPYDQYDARRAWPDEVIDMEGLEMARQSARIARMNKTAGVRFTNVDWQEEGPTNIGGRINAIAMDPNDSDVMLTGSCFGGIFRTSDGGTTWAPIFDDNELLSISEITFEPGNSNVIYAGTGDRNITGYPSIGDGLYRSTDAGQSWNYIGLKDTRIISRIAVDPNDVNRIYVATMGLPMQRNNDRGLYRSTDGGSTWNNILFLSDSTGIIDLVMDPVNTQTLYATGWDRIRTSQESIVSGSNAGVWKSTNGGDTWVELSGGLPGANHIGSRVSISIDQTNNNRLVACYVGNNFQTEAIYETTNAGISWTTIPITSLDPNALGGFGWYFGNIFINPFAPNEIYLQGIGLHYTSNGGQSWNQIDDFSVHADKHDMLFTGPGAFYLATDGGLYRTTNAGLNWSDVDEIPNSQFYRVAANPHMSGQYVGGMQDNGTAFGNNSQINNWFRIFGADGFQPVFTDDPNELLVEAQNGYLAYSTDGGATFNGFLNGIQADRTNWDQPIIHSQHTNGTFYTGTYRLYRTTGGLNNHNWMPISNELTGPVVFRPSFHTLTAIAESPLDQNILYTGSADGKVYMSDDFGVSFTDVSAGLPNRSVTAVKASPYDSNEVIVAMSGYKVNDFSPHLMRSTDRGMTWQSAAGDLPDFALNDVLYDPEADSILVAASDDGVYASVNSGLNWERVGTNMPQVPVYDMDWDLNARQLIAGTYARSMFSFPLDSLRPGTKVSISPPADEIWTIYPNPTTGPVRVQGMLETVQYQIFDVQGRLMQSGQIEPQSSGLDLTQLPAGNYMLQMNDGSRKEIHRILKTN